MGTNLYQEAIAEARQLRDMAEQNAKNALKRQVQNEKKFQAKVDKEIERREKAAKIISFKFMCPLF